MADLNTVAIYNNIRCLFSYELNVIVFKSIIIWAFHLSVACYVSPPLQSA